MSRAMLAAEVTLRSMLLLVLLASGCELAAPADSGELARMQVEMATMTARMDQLELRVLSIEAKQSAPEPAPAPVAAVSPAPAPRPLVVPAKPKPAPAPVPAIEGPIGKVQIASPRDGLKITIDDVERSETTPALILLPPGRHSVKVEGYEKQEIRVIENETTMVIPR